MISPPTLAGSILRDADTAEASLQPSGRLAELLAAARDGNGESLGALLAQYRTYLTLLGAAQFQRRLQARVSPSDVVQETLLRAHRHFGQFRGQTERELIAWLREILLNCLAKFIERHVHAAKRDVRREVAFDSFSEAVASSAQVRRPSEQIGNGSRLVLQESAGQLTQLLNRLPEHYREVLVLRNLQGLSFEQVAIRLDRSPGATRMLWLRAIEKLRAVYRKAEQHDS